MTERVKMSDSRRVSEWLVGWLAGLASGRDWGMTVSEWLQGVTEGMCMEPR